MIHYKLPKNWHQNKNASGGQDFYNTKLNKMVFIDYSGKARIMEIGAGHWDNSIKIKKEDTFREILKKLQEEQFEDIKGVVPTSPISTSTLLKAEWEKGYWSGVKHVEEDHQEKIDKIKTLQDANKEDNMISLEARLHRNDAYNECIKIIK